jgi:DNA polymerase III epsilon subunit-like protein
MWRPSGYIDSLDMAQMVLPKYSEENKDGPSVIRGDTRVASTTLSALAEYLEVRLDRHHSAEQDATAAGMVMHAMINQAESRGWDNRILDRAQREDFLDERTKNFQTAREEFDAAKRRFINFESETARFSSGDDDRPILDVGIPPAKPDRDRPIIKIDPLLKPLRRDELEQLKNINSWFLAGAIIKSDCKLNGAF